MAQQIKQGNIFGRVGSGVGRGLSETLPQEMNRGRLSEGLKRLEGQSLSPIQQYASLIQSGANPEQISQILPYLRGSAIANGPTGGQSGLASQRSGQPMQGGGISTRSRADSFQNYINQSQGGGIPGQPMQGGGGGVQGQPQQNGMAPGKGQPTIAEATPQQAVRTPINRPSPEQIDAGARQLMRDDPALYGDNYPAAREESARRLNYAPAQHEELINTSARQEAAQKKFDENFNQQVAREVNTNQLDPEVNNKVRLKSEVDMLKNGKSEQEAVREGAKKVKELNKALTTLKNDLGGRGFFEKPSPQLGKDVAKLRPIFAENDALEQFRNEQKLAFDIGDHLSSAQTYYPNKEAEKILNSGEKDTKKLAAKLIDTINDESSLWTIGLQAHNAGIDDQQLVEDINELGQNGIIKDYPPRLANEAAAYYPVEDPLTLGDQLWITFGGLGIPGINLFKNYITGKKEKVGPVERLKRQFGKI